MILPVPQKRKLFGFSLSLDYLAATKRGTSELRVTSVSLYSFHLPTFTLEQTTAFLGNQFNLFITAPVENA